MNKLLPRLLLLCTGLFSQVMVFAQENGEALMPQCGVTEKYTWWWPAAC